MEGHRRIAVAESLIIEVGSRAITRRALVVHDERWVRVHRRRALEFHEAAPRPPAARVLSSLETSAVLSVALSCRRVRGDGRLALDHPE